MAQLRITHIPMAKSGGDSSLKYLAPILLISSVLLVHPQYNPATHQLHTSRRSKFATTAFCLGWTALFLCSMHVRVLYIYTRSGYLEIFIDVMDTVCVCLANVSITMSMMNVGRFNKALRKLVEADDVLKLYARPRKAPVWLYVKLALVISVCFAVIVTNVMYYYEKGGFVCLTMAIDYVGKARTVYVIFLIVRFIKHVSFRLKMLDKILKERTAYVNEKTDKLDGTTIRKLRLSRVELDVQNVARAFTLLSEATGAFNVVFGWTILAHSISTVSSTLVLVDSGSDPRNGDTLGVNRFLTAGLVYTGATQLAEMDLVRNCHGVIATARDLATTALRACGALDDARFPFYNRAKEDLALLAKQAAVHTPQVTAAGFFVVDRRILFVLMEITTTQILMLMQLKY